MRKDWISYKPVIADDREAIVDRDELEQAVRCSVCLQVPQHPVALKSCMHRMCKACFDENWRKRTSINRKCMVREVYCPTCKEPIPAARMAQADPEFEALLHAVFGGGAAVPRADSAASGVDGDDGSEAAGDEDEEDEIATLMFAAQARMKGERQVRRRYPGRTRSLIARLQTTIRAPSQTFFAHSHTGRRASRAASGAAAALSPGAGAQDAASPPPVAGMKRTRSLMSSTPTNPRDDSTPAAGAGDAGSASAGSAARPTPAAATASGDAAEGTAGDLMVAIVPHELEERAPRCGIGRVRVAPGTTLRQLRLHLWSRMSDPAYAEPADDADRCGHVAIPPSADEIRLYLAPLALPAPAAVAATSSGEGDSDDDEDDDTSALPSVVRRAVDPDSDGHVTVADLFAELHSAMPAASTVPMVTLAYMVTAPLPPGITLDAARLPVKGATASPAAKRRRGGEG